MQKARGHPKAPSACKHTVSGTISLPCSGCFSPFPHGTCSLSVSQEYLALPDGSGRFTQNFTCSALLRILLGVFNITCTGLSPYIVLLSRQLPFLINKPYCSPTTPRKPKSPRFGLFPFRSPLLRESLLFSCPPGT